LVLPAACLGFTFAQLATILVTLFFPDIFSQLVSSATTPMGFVMLGARTAPSSRLHAAGVLMVLMILLHGVVIGMAAVLPLQDAREGVVLGLAAVIGVAASVAAVYLVYRQERQNRNWPPARMLS
jgi:hypothetical protein